MPAGLLLSIVMSLYQHRHAVTLDPDDPKFMRVRAMAALYRQKYGTAVASYHEALSLRRGKAYNRVGTSRPRSVTLAHCRSGVMQARHGGAWVRGSTMITL